MTEKIYGICSGSDRKRYIRIIVERTLGRSLLPEEVIHHKDGEHFNNEPSNLVVCRDQAEHKLLHRKADALKACGHEGWRKCWICHEYDSPENLSIKEHNIYHRSCMSQYVRERRDKQ